MNEQLNEPLAKPLAETPVEVKQKDWEIIALYKNSWQIIKKHKILWLFGMAVSASGASYSYNSSRSTSEFSQKDMEMLQRFFPSDGQAAPQDLSMVLGTATNAIGEKIAAIFANIPPYFYLMLGIELLLLLSTAIVIAVIYRGWAEAGLVESIQTAMANGTVTIRDTSEKAFKHIKAIVFLRYVPFLALFGIFIVLTIIAALMGPIAPLFALVSIVGLAYGLLIVTFSQIWAIRKAVLEHTPAKKAFKDGYHIARKKFWAMLLLGIVNILLGLVISFVILGPGIMIMLFGLLSDLNNPMLNLAVFITGIIILYMSSMILGVVNGILTAFKDTVWSHAYVTIKGKYDK